MRGEGLSLLRHYGRVVVIDGNGVIVTDSSCVGILTKASRTVGDNP